MSYTDLDGLEVSETFKCKVKVKFAIFLIHLVFCCHALIVDRQFVYESKNNIFMSLCAQVHV